MLRPCLLTTIIARVFREGVRSNTYKSLWSISWNKVALFINIGYPNNHLAGLILLLVWQKGQLLRCEVERGSMVGGGAPKEKDPVPNPVQRWGDIFVQSMYSRYILSNLARAWRLLGLGPDPKGLLSFHVQTLPHIWLWVLSPHGNFTDLWILYSRGHSSWK